MTARSAAIIPAGGLGTRLATPGAPKAVRLLAGQSLVRRSALTLAPFVDTVVVAAPADHLDDVRRELTDLPSRVDVVPGGVTRQESVRLALAAVPPSCDRIIVHDAARPLVPAAVVARVLEALDEGAVAVVPVIPVVDTLRQVSADGTSRLLDRAGVRAVQTPQGFTREVLAAAHAVDPGSDATDDAGLVERLGHPVSLVDGDPLAFKITRPLDLALAEALLQQR